MSSTALKIIAAVTVLLALILAVAGYRMSRQYAESAEKARQQAQAAPQTLAVVAVHPLSAEEAIKKDDVTLVPVAIVPADYFTTVDDVVGRTPLIDVDAGAPLTARYFKEGHALARVIPPGFQAVSLEVDDVIAVGGFLRPGDQVDVLVYLRGGPGVGEPQARILLKDLRVLAYEERIIDRPKGLPAEDKGAQAGRRQRTAVLAVAEADATKLMLGVSLGAVRLALHGETPPVPELTAGEVAAAAQAQPQERVFTAAQLAQTRETASKKAAEEQRRIQVIRGEQVEKVTP